MSRRSGRRRNGDARAPRAGSPTLETLRRDRDAYARAGVDYLIVGPRQPASVAQLEAMFANAAAALAR